MSSTSEQTAAGQAQQGPDLTLFLIGQHFGNSLGKDYLGLLGLACYWITALAGLALLARWLPSSGRHAQSSTDDDWSEGPGLSVVAHVGGALWFWWRRSSDGDAGDGATG